MSQEKIAKYRTLPSMTKRFIDELRSCQSRTRSMPELKSQEYSGFIQSRQNVCGWLRSIQAMPPRKPTPPDPNNDLKVFRQTIGSVMDALDAQILTDEEADALVQFITGRFVSRRIEERLTCLPTSNQKHWFCIAHETERHQ